MIDIRSCNQCGLLAPLKDFQKGKRKQDGSWYRRRKCKKCYLKVKKQYRTNKRNTFIKWKKTLACKDCNYSKKTHQSFTHSALDFHHHNDNKSYSIGNMINQGGFAWSTIVKEINKCTILCCRCHRERHSKE